MKQLLVLILVATISIAGTYRWTQGHWPFLGHDDHDMAGHDHSAHGAEAAGQTNARRILYYRNPMGLPDTSPVPKKDSMGMDYIPVYADDAMEDGAAIVISPARLQRSGYRDEIVARRALTTPVAAPMAIKADERRVKTVTLRMESFIEKLYVDTTGQVIREGQPLFRFVSQQLQQTEIDLLIGTRSTLTDGNQQAQGAMQRLRNLGMPESHIRDIVASRTLPRYHDWPAPIGGTVLVKAVLEGQRVAPGDELYRIADLSNVWAIADVAERDIGRVRIGDPVVLSFHAMPGRARDGRVAFVSPELRPETRTVPIRIELANADGALRLDMLGEALIRPAAEVSPVLAVSRDAVIDSGRQQVAIVVLGEGRFEPRQVRIGRRSSGLVEILEGLSEGDAVVSTANFLIDAESNLRAALKALESQGAKP